MAVMVPGRTTDCVGNNDEMVFGQSSDSSTISIGDAPTRVPMGGMSPQLAATLVQHFSQHISVSTQQKPHMALELINRTDKDKAAIKSVVSSPSVAVVPNATNDTASMTRDAPNTIFGLGINPYKANNFSIVEKLFWVDCPPTIPFIFATIDASTMLPSTVSTLMWLATASSTDVEPVMNTFFSLWSHYLD